MQGRMVERREVRPDGIGEAALFAHFAEQARGEHAAAEDVVHRRPLRSNPDPCGRGRARRNAPRIAGSPRSTILRCRCPGGRRSARRQAAPLRGAPPKTRSSSAARRLGVDGAHHGDLQRIAGEEALAVRLRDRRARSSAGSPGSRGQAGHRDGRDKPPRRRPCPPSSPDRSSRAGCPLRSARAPAPTPRGPAAAPAGTGAACRRLPSGVSPACADGLTGRRDPS